MWSFVGAADGDLHLGRILPSLESCCCAVSGLLLSYQNGYIYIYVYVWEFIGFPQQNNLN